MAVAHFRALLKILSKTMTQSASQLTRSIHVQSITATGMLGQLLADYKQDRNRTYNVNSVARSRNVYTSSAILTA